MTIIFILSAQPYEKQNIQPCLTGVIDLTFLKPYIGWISFNYHKSEVSVEAMGIAGFIEFFIRKGAHVFAFFVLCCLFYFALHKTMPSKSIKQLIVSFVLTFLYAGFDEFHQGFTENRTSYIGDVFLDGFGGLLAIGLITIYRQR
jgi:glycopeptide antibiotics resistance protein